MRQSVKRLGLLLVLVIGEGAVLSALFFVMVWSGGKGIYALTILCLIGFFPLRKLFWAWEDRWNIKSPSNPKRTGEIGVTFIAPWLKKPPKKDSMRNENRKKKRHPERGPSPPTPATDKLKKTDATATGGQ